MNSHLCKWMLSVGCLFFYMATPSIGIGQQWAREMFETTEHDFGTVPRGAKSEFEFKIKNKYREDVHIVSVRTSCPCTLPQLKKRDFKTYEEDTAVVAEFNTKAFVGARSAVVTVVFDRPFYAEVQLNVKGNIRSDILPQPGEVQFGDVDVGSEKSATVNVSYSGKADWTITDVRSTNQHLAVKLEKVAPANGKVQYNMVVRLKPEAPAGELADEIVLVTNEAQYNMVTLPVRASIIPPISMPASLELGTIKVGQAVKDRLLIRAKEPFSIEKIDCSDARFKFDPPKGEKKAHLIPFEFVADAAGAFRQSITVHTSLKDPSTAETTVVGNVE